MFEEMRIGRRFQRPPGIIPLRRAAEERESGRREEDQSENVLIRSRIEEQSGGGNQDQPLQPGSLLRNPAADPAARSTIARHAVNVARGLRFGSPRASRWMSSSLCNVIMNGTTNAGRM